MEEIDVPTLFERYAEDCRLRDMTKETIRSYLSELKIYRQFLVDHEIDILDIHNQELEKFLLYLRDERQASQSRVENYFSALASFYDFLVYKEIITTNLVLPFRKRFLKRFKKNVAPAERKIISVDDMSQFVNGIIPVRDRAIAVVLAKTGIRRGELLTIEVSDVDFVERTILLKPFHKRSNRMVFFDEETELLLRRWLKQRSQIVATGVTALFVNEYGEPIGRSAVYNAVVGWAKRLGYYEADSKRLEDHFSCHNFRHWFTTHLLRNGMPREYVKELRGDIRGEAIDIYYHIDKKELKRAYLAAIPKLHVY